MRYCPCPSCEGQHSEAIAGLLAEDAEAMRIARDMMARTCVVPHERLRHLAENPADVMASEVRMMAHEILRGVKP